MEAAAPVIRQAIPDANVPTSIRSSDVGVRYGAVSELESVLTTWLAQHDQSEGIAAVIATTMPAGAQKSSRVRLLSPQLAKGLEFDLVVLIDPEDYATGIEGAVDHYVAMTRATQQLVILYS